METDLIFQQDLHLPEFAAFVLLNDAMGTAALQRYFDPYVAIARKHKVGIILESHTWRANHDWGERLGYDGVQLAEINRKAIALLQDIRDEANYAAEAIGIVMAMKATDMPGAISFT